MILLSPADHYHYTDEGEPYAKSVSGRNLPSDYPAVTKDDRLDRVVRPMENVPQRYALTLRDVLDHPILRSYGGVMYRFTETEAVISFPDLRHAVNWAEFFDGAVIPVTVGVVTPDGFTTFNWPVTVKVEF